MNSDNITTIGKMCTGCRACEQACPRRCIEMKENEEGFLYPVVNEAFCIHCGYCRKVCAQTGQETRTAGSQKYFAFRNFNRQELMQSASGGIADVASSIILQKGGYVFGAAYTDELEVRHICIKENKERSRLQSSKYVQSDTGNCFTEARTALEEGGTVLFTGTPCQIDGLKHFLERDYEKLYTIDLICHGVPSPAFFRNYIFYMESQMGGKLSGYNFRSKEEKGWGTYYQAKTDLKCRSGSLYLDRYGKHFMNADCFRECCYECRYANLNNRPADLSVGDFWAVCKYYPNMEAGGGVSSVIVNTQKGAWLLAQMKPYAEIFPITKEELLEKQGNLIHPAVRPAARDEFYYGIWEDNYIKQLRVGIQLKERVKQLVPMKVRNLLKRT